MAKVSKKSADFARILTWVLVIGAAVGIFASGTLTIDKIKMLENPSYKPSCSINPIISCGSVTNSPQGSVFGFYTPIIGLVAYGALLAVGMAMLAGGRFKRWFWLGLEAGALFGVGFVHWLFFQSIYRINALCLFCILVWSVTIPIFYYTSLYNLDTGNIKVAKKFRGLVDFVRRHHVDLLVLWLAVIAALILKHFWYYFGP